MNIYQNIEKQIFYFLIILSTFKNLGTNHKIFKKLLTIFFNTKLKSYIEKRDATQDILLFNNDFAFLAPLNFS